MIGSPQNSVHIFLESCCAEFVELLNSKEIEILGLLLFKIINIE